MTQDRRDSNNEFEDFIKESSEDFLMNPSENVWSNINNELHTTPKWPFYALAIIFVSLGVFTNFNQTRQEPSILLSSAKNNEIIVSYPAKQKITSQNREFNKPEVSITAKNTTLSISNISRPTTRISEADQIKSVIKITAPASSAIKTLNISSKENDFVAVKKMDHALTTKMDHASAKIIDHALADIENIERTFSKTEGLVNKYPSHSNLNKAYQTQPLTDIYPSINKDEKMSRISLNAASSKQRKNAWAFYFTPSVSYRKLYGTAQAFNNYIYTRTDVNSAVRHLPMMGMELGSSIIFNYQRKFRFKVGLQFNLNQYDIRAYNAGPEVTSLSVSGIGQVPINTIAYHRNFDGFKETWLKNKHIMVSMPVATELRIMGDKKLSLNIGAGIQPTYMLSESPYLISSNLKNYAKAPSGLLRDLNITGSLESFVSYKSGSVRWTMGPQFRYQMLSNFKKTYPFTEHLTDFGFKVGIIKSFK